MNRVPYLIALFVFTLFCGVTPMNAQTDDYRARKADAERFFNEGSYEKAREIYEKIDVSKLPPAETRWVKFRLADTRWRSLNATNQSDQAGFETARQELEALVRDVRREADRDLVWAEVQESLGDFWWMRQYSRNWYQGWQNYQLALDWWANSRNLDTARDRYLKIIFKASATNANETYYFYGYYSVNIPVEFLDNALKIAKREEDKSQLHYLIAMGLRYRGGDYESRMRVAEEFEASLKFGKTSEWYDDALYSYGEWMASTGDIIANDDGSFRQEVNYVKALDLFKRVTTEFRKGETRYYDQAKSQIENIVTPQLAVGVSNVFLPGSEIQFYANWRNLKKIDYAIYKVNLPNDSKFVDESDGSQWMQRFALDGRQPFKTISRDGKDKGDYRPQAEAIRLDSKLDVGAYLVVARSNGKEARELILVTDTAIVTKTAGTKLLVFTCNALDGSPVPETSVRVWQRYYENSKYHWREYTALTNNDGIATIDKGETGESFVVFSASGDRQALSFGYGSGSYDPTQGWRIYAFTDRPAYRPGDTVQWKIFARILKEKGYTTPADQPLDYVIMNPRGEKVAEGKLRLNQFGSGWGATEVTAQMPLGEYRVEFGTKKSDDNFDEVGSAVLFRLEEYKLPEFKVGVKTPEENGKRKAFRLGEKVEVEVSAEYYFGGAVANGTAEVIVYQNPFYRYFPLYREYPFLYEDDSPYRNYGYNRGQQVKRETLKLSAEGKAKLIIDTPRFNQQDLEYRIEARVTDSSRREVVSEQTVRVTRQRFAVNARPEHYVYRPSEKMAIDFTALDANDNPVVAEGQVVVTRETWKELYLDVNDKVVTAEEIRKRNDGKPYRLKFRGYEREEISKQTVKTDATGKGRLEFTAPREGYYRVVWTTPEKGRNPIVAETTAWCSTAATNDLGYNAGSLEIIADSDTFKVGQTAPVLLAAPTGGRTVLFTVERTGLDDVRVIRMTGTAKLVELPIGEADVPNIFLHADSVYGATISQQVKPIVVPPTAKFLKVEVKADKEQYQPRESGTLTITTKDADGRPVPAEVSVAVSDEAVTYIQQDFAGDPRKFFYGDKRNQHVQTQCSFNYRSYQKLLPAPEPKEGQTNTTPGNARNEGMVDDVSLSGGMAYARQAPASEVVAMDAAKPAAPPSPVAGASMAKSAEGNRAERKQKKDSLKEERDSRADGGEAAPNNVTVRSDFRATALWKPDVVTDANGQATVKVTYPDSLTTWKAVVRAATPASQFGMGEGSSRTNQPLLVRLQNPRFLVTGDTVTISAVVNNNTAQPLTTTVFLEAPGLTLSGGSQTVTVPAKGEIRADWTTTVPKPGSVKLKASVKGGSYADAMERELPMFDRGIEKFIAQSGKVRGNEGTFTVNLPDARDNTRFSVQVSPSLAVTMLDALPYLIDYPYGCTEQTMSRFLPAVIVAKTLRDQGVKPEDIAGKVFGGIEPANVGKTQPKGKKDLAKLDEMTTQGLQRLYDFQHSDGGWGWWKETSTDRFMTAYVVWGLALAKQSGVKVNDDVLRRGADYLRSNLVDEETSPDRQAWMLHALAEVRVALGVRETGEFEKKAIENLWKRRDAMNAYTRSLFTIAAHRYGDTEKSVVLIRNLENGVKRDTAPNVSRVADTGAQETSGVMGTAHWGEDGFWYRWSDGGVEATAFALKALLTVDPNNALIEPTMNWLIKNRRGAQWSNTRDTAIVVLAMNDYLKTSKETTEAANYTVFVNGKPVAKRTVSLAEILSAPSRFEVPADALKSGANEVRVVKTSGKALYVSAEATFFSRESPIAAAGNEIFVKRQYYKLVATPTLLKGFVYERIPLNDGDTVASGDRVECVVTMEAKNNYEYLLFEDLKPAGFEATQLKSGELMVVRQVRTAAGGDDPDDASRLTGQQESVYQELRDRKVAVFVDRLPEGLWEMRYEFRAETPGRFSALPVIGHAMYVPEIRCNGAEVRIVVK
jgi:uncharacterized protein YfaS (alpha-2-macroglobulin family)